LRSLYGTKYSGESIFASRGKTNPYLHDLSHGLGLFLKEPPQSINETYIQFERVLSAYERLSKKKSFKLITCCFPQRYQCNWLDYKATLTDYDLKENAFSPSPAISYWNSKGHLVVSEYLFENIEHE